MQLTGQGEASIYLDSLFTTDERFYQFLDSKAPPAL